HSVSHFSQLLLAPLFPWLKDAFHVSYAQLGLLMTLFFTVSCTVQALSGFVVDRRGPLPVLLGGLGSIVLAALGYSASQSYWQLLMFSVVAGVGNGVFHPVDYTLINKKVSEARLGHAYSVHGVTGSLGWALAPALLVPIAITHSWRMAIVAGAAVAFAVWLLIWFNRERLVLPSSTPPHAPGARAESTFAFLRIPAVWVCFGFFLFFAASLSGVQTFAPEAARQLHQVERSVTGMCLSIYMVCSALGMIAGGFMLKDPSRCERIVGIGFGLAAVIAVTMAVADVPAMAVPVMFGLMGLFTGTAGPSRDLIVKRASPPNASGRVYGVVYSGLDIGQALAPLLYGALMDMHMPAAVWLSIAVVQGVLVVSAFNVRRARRTRLQPA
ncbi:MAG TPA: MFS transporter, partial [Burkholderiaceae bacterium]|nr:MFS transporter [Burkholderiaceae bacterium]